MPALWRGGQVLLHNPENENINMNQVFSGIDIEIQAGNPQASVEPGALHTF